MSPQRLYGDRPKPDLEPVKIQPSSAAAIGIALPLAFVWKGYLLTWIWLWFAVPLGLPPISIPMAIGLNVIVIMLVPAASLHRDYEWRSGEGFYAKPQWAAAPAVNFFSSAFLNPLPNFAVAWIVSLWLP